MINLALRNLVNFRRKASRSTTYSTRSGGYRGGTSTTPFLLSNLAACVRWSLFRQAADANGYLNTFEPSLYDPAKAPQVSASGNLVADTGDPLNGFVIGGKNSPSRTSINYLPELRWRSESPPRIPLSPPSPILE